MLSRPVFPAEIFDIILEQIPCRTQAVSAREYSESKFTLSNFSLVSSSFRDGGQKRLFNDANVHLPPLTKGHGILNHVLSSSARLRSFIIKLRLAISPAITNSQVEFNPVLPNLADLCIVGYSRAQFNWSDTKPYQSSLYTLMRGPTLSRLTIRNIYNFPVSLLGSCTQLKELSTRYIKYNDTDFINIPILTAPVHQTYLKTISSSDFAFPNLTIALVKPSFPLSAARLRKLSLVVPNQATCAALKVVLDEAGAHLDELDLSFHSGTYLIPPHSTPFFADLDANRGFELSQDVFNLPNPAILRHVAFRNRMNDIPQVIMFLSQIPETNKLSSVLIYRSILYSSSIPAHDTKDSSWQQLDEVLTRERHAVQFQRLELRDIYPALYAGSGELWTRASRLLPRLTTSNRVVVSDVDPDGFPLI